MEDILTIHYDETAYTKKVGRKTAEEFAEEYGEGVDTKGELYDPINIMHEDLAFNAKVAWALSEKRGRNVYFNANHGLVYAVNAQEGTLQLVKPKLEEIRHQTREALRGLQREEQE